MSFHIVQYAKEHPYITAGVAVVGVGVFVVFSGAFSGGSGSSSGASTSGTSQAVQIASIQAEAQLQAAQTAAGASVAQTNSQTELGKRYLDVQQAIALNTNQASVDSALINTIGNIAVNAPLTTSSGSSSGSFFGLFGGGSKSTSTKPSDETPAYNALVNIFSSFNNPAGTNTPGSAATVLSGTGLGGITSGSGGTTYAVAQTARLSGQSHS